MKQDTPKNIRQRAASSVSQDMNSARLRILSDLMDSRKKAEAHEQEFLKTIQSENAAFSKVVSLFDDSIDGLESSILALRGELEHKFAEFDSESGTKMESIMLELNKLKQSYSQNSDVFKGEVWAAIAASDERLELRLSSSDSQHLKLSSMASDLSTRLDTEVSRISQDQCCLRDSLLDKIAGLDSAIQLLNSRLNEIVSSHGNHINEQWSSFEDMLRRHNAEMSEHIESRMMTLESSMKKCLDEKLESYNPEKLESTSLLLSERVDSLRQELLGQMQESNSQLVSRCECIEASLRASSASKPLIDESVLSALETRLQQRWQENLSSQMTLLVDQVSDLDMRISARLGNQDSAIQALQSTGYFHEWTIRDAKSKFHSLGLMSSGGKFVSSEIFSIGPYSNLQLRLYPVSSSLSNSPSIWLIHSPSGNDPAAATGSLPTYVDLGIGKTKKSLCKMKKVQELFGHWVWEGNGFDRDFISREVDATGSLVVIVEISMRQWLAPPPSETVPLESFPDSPMSAYTFAGGIEGRITPQLPLRPMSTNPFENSSKEGKKSALTPRRMSWAMFGDGPVDEISVSSSNPFSS